MKLLPIAAALSVGLVACGGHREAAVTAEGERVRVVTTISPITNIVANVAGDLAVIEGLVPEGVNGHAYEPSPGAAKLIADADLIFINGLELEEPTRRLAEANLGANSELIALGDTTLARDEYIYDSAFPETRGAPNPHLWTSPRYVALYAEEVMKTLSLRDPPNAPAYQRNYERFAARLDDFDRALAAATASVPERDRKLLSYHDSFPYFAKDYGWTIVGAIQPSDFGDPTPRDVARLIDQLREERVATIFGSEAFPSPVLEQIARETGASYVAGLRDDDLPGEPGDADHSLLALLQFDYATIIGALGGDASIITELDTSNVVPDEANY